VTKRYSASEITTLWRYINQFIIIIIIITDGRVDMHDCSELRKIRATALSEQVSSLLVANQTYDSAVEIDSKTRRQGTTNSNSRQLNEYKIQKVIM